MKRKTSKKLCKNEHLLRWVEKTARLTNPARIHWVDGSQEEYDRLCQEMVDGGTFIPLNEKLWPGCFLARSDASDVARVEDRTFICSLSKDNAGPDQQLGKPLRHAAQAERAFQRFHEGPDHVCTALQHGAGGVSDVADRSAAYRFALCRGQHADHGAHRVAGV